MTSLSKIATPAAQGATTLLKGAASTVSKAASPEIDKLKGAAKQFEAVFLRQMIGSMRSASDGDGLFDSSATQQFRDMSDAKLAEQMASKGALHIADMLVKAYGARLAGGSAAAASAEAQAKTAVTTAATAVTNATTSAVSGAVATAAATLKIGSAQ